MERVLSIRQPWAWLIVNGFKPVENRSRPTKIRGTILIQAPMTFDGVAFFKLRVNDLQAQGDHHTGGPRLSDAELERLREIWPGDRAEGFQFGGIVGQVDITDCVQSYPSRWFTGPYGYVLANPKPVPFYSMKGKLGFFRAENGQS